MVQSLLRLQQKTTEDFMRICKDCAIEKELSEFYKNGKYYRRRCRKCHILKFNPPTGKPHLGRFKKGHHPVVPFEKDRIPWNKGKKTGPAWNKGLRNTGFKPANGFTKGHKRNTGKIRTKEHTNKISKTRFEMSSSRHCNKHRAWKKDVWERDGYECKFCGSNEMIVAHHIRLWNNFPELRFELNNGITMCNSCHTILHSTGRVFSDDHRKKLSIAGKSREAPSGAFKKGHVPWNKGTKLGDS